MSEKNEVIGATGAVTGFETTDPKDGHTATYTTTPPSGQVSSADSGAYEPVQVPSGKEVTASFDHLATRDPQAMEAKLQRPEYEGAVSNAALGIDAAVVNAVAPAGDLQLTAPVTLSEQRERAIDPNPHYTPASGKAPAHMPERRPDLGQPAMPDAVVERGEIDLNDR